MLASVLAGASIGYQGEEQLVGVVRGQETVTSRHPGLIAWAQHGNGMIWAWRGHTIGKGRAVGDMMRHILAELLTKGVPQHVFTRGGVVACEGQHELTKGVPQHVFTSLGQG